MDTYAEEICGLVTGQQIDTSSVTITESHVVNWASLTGDWYPVHMDEMHARKQTNFGARLVHGPFVFALCIGLFERTGRFGNGVIAWLGADEVRATAPVFIGDTLRARVEVKEARLSKSKPDRAIVSLLYEALNQDGDVVLRFRSGVMMRVRTEVSGR